MKQTRVIGIEFGSTRIKAVLLDENAVIASGDYEWASTLRDGFWSYELSEVVTGLQASYAALAKDYQAKTGEVLREVSAIGISAMMHGYLAFDKQGELLVPFRTWQNANTAKASAELTEAFHFHVPLRWSVSHFYEAVLTGEPHVKDVASLNTLAGYVHYLLTDRLVLGVCDASGMFPLEGGAYSPRMMKIMNEKLAAHGCSVDFETLLPSVLQAGDEAGRLTEKGAKLLDPTGNLRAGCPLCPPEGDAGTGMIATNSVRVRSANVSAGTSGFLMAVMEKDLSRAYEEIDVMCSPFGNPVAMIHAANFTPEINAWVDLIGEAVMLFDGQVSRGELFDRLYEASLKADEDVGGLVAYNYRVGEHMVECESGAPLLARDREGRLNLPNLMKAQIYSALGVLAIGMEILREERVSLDSVIGHGGFFKAGKIAQSAMSAAIGAPITVMEQAGEGGAWGIGLLAMMTALGEHDGNLFLDRIFDGVKSVTVSADEGEINRFAHFMERYQRMLPVERKSAEILNL
ncbi:MAG: ATPase [Clostridia bacterium]|nr:ATPase [Clostridia bacterium]